jgi:hypothetical protein
MAVMLAGIVIDAMEVIMRVVGVRPLGLEEPPSIRVEIGSRRPHATLLYRVVASSFPMAVAIFFQRVERGPEGRWKAFPYLLLSLGIARN